MTFRVESDFGLRMDNIKFPKNPIKPLLLFKIKNTIYLDEDMVNAWCEKPIHMTLADSLLLYGIEKSFDIEDFMNFEKEHQIRIRFFKLCSIKQNSKEIMIGRRCSSVPGHSYPSLDPRFIINIGKILP